MSKSSDDVRVQEAKQEHQHSEADPEGSPGMNSKPEHSSASAPVNVAQDPHVFPEGGAQAWLTVAGSAAFLFVSFGWINLIGIFQQYYQETLLSDYTPSQIAWIPSLMRMLLPSAPHTTSSIGIKSDAMLTRDRYPQCSLCSLEVYWSAHFLTREALLTYWPSAPFSIFLAWCY
jgi:hypothetical protein